MKKPSELFRDAYLRSLTKPYETKFKEGDVIMNVSYGVVSLVVRVMHGMDVKYIPGVNNDVPLQIKDTAIQYELKDIKNSKTKKDILKKSSRYQNCQIIDKFYEQVNPETARLLYGVG